MSGLPVIGTVELTPPTAAREWPERITMMVMATPELLEVFARIEVKLDRLIRALEAGAVGRWQ